jgi:hypothetical protein
MVSEIRSLTAAEITRLQQQGCTCADWSRVKVAENFSAERIRDVHFSGDVQVGQLTGTIKFPGGLVRSAGLARAAIHNCKIGDNVYISNVANYIANYTIEDDVVIENVDLLAVEGESTFGNGTQICVLNEAGGREVPIYDGLTAQIAYILALYRHRSKTIENIQKMIARYAASVKSCCGLIARGARISNSGSLKNIKVGSSATVEGATRLEDGTINSCREAPAYIGPGVIARDFIVSTGAKISDGVILSHCFVGQATVLGRQFSAENSAFFANCEGFHGEACSLFAGPYSVTHHKSSLLIAAMCSFYNAGSGSNQSNHMYKLGPVHQGIIERGSKTGSFSYLFWPAKIGAFSAVIGKHYARFDSSDLPFSYILEADGKSVLIPAVNLATVGTVRDSAKWPKRDKRKDPRKNDLINFKALSPFTVQRMMAGQEVLKKLQAGRGKKSEYVAYGELNLPRKALKKGVDYYQTGIDKYLGDCLVERLQGGKVESAKQLAGMLSTAAPAGCGKWLDLFGLLVPQEVLEEILQKVETGKIATVEQLADELRAADRKYGEYEWAWVIESIEKMLGKGIKRLTGKDIGRIVRRWQKAVQNLNDLILNDARKEFGEAAMIGYGSDGDRQVKEGDFAAVRGSYDDNSFVASVKEDTLSKAKVADEIVCKLEKLV